MKFALFFGNRGFMPAELIAGARADMIRAVADAGHESLVMDADCYPLRRGGNAAKKALPLS